MEKEEAMKILKDFRNKSALFSVRTALDTVFPELAESGDEEVRKAIITFFESEDDNTTYSLVPKKDILTWLEKQGNISKEITCTQEVEVGNGNIKALVTEKLDSTNTSIEDEDERIRKSIIAILNNYVDNSNTFKPKMLAWLEKQGQQNLAKNIIEIWKNMRLEVYQQATGNRHEPNYSDDTTKIFSLNDIDEIIEKISEQKYADGIPTATNYDKMFQNYKIHKFNVGDWIVSSVLGIAHIIGVNDANEYQLEYIDGKQEFSSIDYVNYEYDEWTIKDANDGDVLAVDNKPFIYNGSKNEVTVGAYCGFNAKHMFSFAYNYVINQDIHPATKEQRNLLFAKMKEAGWEWDETKKKLKKIEQELASSAKTCENDTLLDLLHKMPSFITVDGVDYYFVMKKTNIYTAYYKALPINSPLLPIFGVTSYRPIDLLTEMLEKLKKEGLLE